jgi:hypothetical protein
MRTSDEGKQTRSFRKQNQKKNPVKANKDEENGRESPNRCRRLLFFALYIYMSVAIAKGCQAIITNGPKIVKFSL